MNLIEAKYVTVEIDADQKLLDQVRPILTAEGLTVEQSIVLFFRWCVDYPELAKKTIMEWRKEMEENGKRNP